jgi:pyruvate/2-oxoglutarate dehydrogenase complex dihydrolipoamide acyltransferase (E2) component
MSILTELTIPMMGSVEHARLVQWLVEEGSAFFRGESLYELETDKTVTTVEAEEDGILVRTLGEEGQEFLMGDPVALQVPAGTSAEVIERELARHDAGSSEEAGADNALAQAAPEPASSRTVGARGALPATVPVKSSPRSRKLAREHGVDITTVTGTGPRGRVTGDDVLREAAMVPAGGEEREPVSALSADRREPVQPAPEAQSAGTSIPHSSRRRAIARVMAEAKREAPHLTADMDVDLSAVMAFRRRYKHSGHPAPSILGIVASHAARLLCEHKSLNATFRDDDMMLWSTVNLNVGIDTEAGLVAPVIRDAQLLTAMEMTDRIAVLAQRAREGRLSQEDLTGGTFTVSNPGAIGPVVRAEAVLNGPQVALLGMPGIQQKPFAVRLPDDSFAIQVRPILRLGVTFDHRALDGGPVIRFLNGLKQGLESIDR